MQTPERVISPRQLHRLSPLLLGLWLLAIVLATFQPCAEAAEALSKAVGTGKLSGHHERDSRCQRAEAAHEKPDCCADKHYISCNLPDVIKHDDALSMSVVVYPASARNTTFLLCLDEAGQLQSRTAAYHPPAYPASILLSVTRLLI